jgi:hypothetical protein
MLKSTSLAAVAALSLFALAGSTQAQPAPTPAPTPAMSHVREACMSSMQTLCPTEVAAMDRAAVRACLIKNIDKATPACQTAVKDAQAARAAGH